MGLCATLLPWGADGWTSVAQSIRNYSQGTPFYNKKSRTCAVRLPEQLYCLGEPTDGQA